MSRAKRIDGTQQQIVAELRSIPGVTVEVDHDDILVGYRDNTYWFEIKDPDSVINKSNGIKAGSFKKSQINLIKNWTGHYRIVWNIDQILKDLGITK